MTFKIFQMKHGHVDKFEDTKKKNVNLDDYDKVYEGNLSLDEVAFKTKNRDTDVLEELFFIFNMDHPLDFKGHSLSVSDVVCLGTGLKANYYFCASMGWRKVEPFYAHEFKL